MQQWGGDVNGPSGGDAELSRGRGWKVEKDLAPQSLRACHPEDASTSVHRAQKKGQAVRVAREWLPESPAAAQDHGTGFQEGGQAAGCVQGLGKVDAGFQMASNLLACLDEDSDDYDVGAEVEVEFD